MKRRRVLAPNMRSTFIVMSALHNYIPNERVSWEMRRSEKGIPNVRYQATTRGIDWVVDLYLGHFYRVRVGTHTGEVFRSIPALLGYLVRKLGLRREP